MLSVFRRLMKSEQGTLTLKYTVISTLLASTVVLFGIVYRLFAAPAPTAGI